MDTKAVSVTHQPPDGKISIEYDMIVSDEQSIYIRCRFRIEEDTSHEHSRTNERCAEAGN
ncbi:hypothetical protein PO124_05315 [Bacillus licheniformis]|nr:hypothetical protein [Bacillus licheniformis]